MEYVKKDGEVWAKVFYITAYSIEFSSKEGGTSIVLPYSDNGYNIHNVAARYNSLSEGDERLRREKR